MPEAVADTIVGVLLREAVMEAVNEVEPVMVRDGDTEATSTSDSAQGGSAGGMPAGMVVTPPQLSPQHVATPKALREQECRREAETATAPL